MPVSQQPHAKTQSNKINPKHLLHSKWTATLPTNKEKHFMVVEVEYSEEGDVTHCLIEAVLSKRQQAIDWRDLKNQHNWLTGWK